MDAMHAAHAGARIQVNGLPQAISLRWIPFKFNKPSAQSGIILTLAALFTFFIWAACNRPIPRESGWSGRIKCVSFSPYRNDQSPFRNRYPSHEQIRDDLHLLRSRFDSVRTYSSANGMEVVPGLAAAMGLKVTAGAWIDKRGIENERELANLEANAQRYQSTINRVIVGNEALLRNDVTPDQLIAYLDRVRSILSVPVSTAEPWHIWLKYPELAQHVDYIAVHVLPYWEGVPLDQAADWVVDRYNQIRKAFPDKPVWLAEVGWPTSGERFRNSKPGRVNASLFTRRFLKAADRLGLDYSIMEAFDQPWKKRDEGRTGAYWGVYDANRQEKLMLSGPLRERVSWLIRCLTAMLGLLPVSLYLWVNRRQVFRGRLFYALLLQAAACGLVWMLYTPLVQDFYSSDMWIWLTMLPLQIALLGVILINGAEMSDMLWHGGLQRVLRPVEPPPAVMPRVCIHVPICREPPEMVVQTLDSLAALDYPDFEVMVIDNNTPEEQLWRPVEQHCARLGSRFRFFHLPSHPGYKAGALNYALRHTAPECDIIAVVDSDYIVRPDWLKTLVPHFQRDEVGVVQAPQDHRLWQDDLFKTMCAWEYHGFFVIGMVYRNERNAIIQHGTMTLIRRKVLDACGWAEWCICEDAELGLRVLDKGFEAVYTPESFGQGLTPDSFAGYKRQRFRWAYGAMQILKHHRRTLFAPGGTGKLTSSQRFQFIAGWIPWLSDALNYVLTILWIFWAAATVAAPTVFGPPLAIFLYPVIAAFAFKMIHFISLYRSRVRCSLPACLGAAVAGLALTPAIGKAMLSGLLTSNRPFMRTPKCENRPALMQAFLMAREEIITLALLLLSAARLAMNCDSIHGEVNLWVAVMLLHALPCAAAAVMALLSALPVSVRRAARAAGMANASMGRA